VVELSTASVPKGGRFPRAAPELRLVVNNAMPEVRALDVALDGNAALDLAPTAARPALSLVPEPLALDATTATTGLSAVPQAMPWLAPGMFALNTLRPATALATGIRKRTGATVGIGITGIAGPGGGTPDKPVGLVHIGLADERGTKERAYRFPGDRDRIRLQATVAALDMVRRHFLYATPGKG